MRTQKKKISGLRVGFSPTTIVLCRGALLRFLQLNARSFKKVFNSLNDLFYRPAWILFLHQFSNFPRKFFGAKSYKGRINVLFHILSDSAFPRLGRYTLAWDTSENGSFRSSCIIAVDEARRNGMQSVNINNESHDLPLSSELLMSRIGLTGAVDASGNISSPAKLHTRAGFCV